LGEALDYAAQGKRGLNFHDPRGNLARPYPYSELRADALAMRLSPDRARHQAKGTGSR
jgi:fatty-acyl-CoA synthase